MADRRMFAKSIVQGSRFLKMPVSSRELYFQMGMSADDDGIVEAWNVMKLTSANEDDLRVLVSKGYVQILDGDDLIAYLTDWSVNNSIRRDRYHESVYKDLKVKLSDGNQASTEWQPNGNQVPTLCQPSDNQCETEVRLGKERLGKGRLVEDRLGKGGVGGTYTGSSKRTSKVEKNLEMLQTIGSEYGFDDFVYEKLTEWMKYKGEIGFVYKEQGAKSFFTQTKKSLENYGADAVVSAIDTAIASGWKGFYPEKSNQKVSGGIDWSRV